jgi:hypothetical protein
MYELMITRMEAEIDWCGRIADRLDAGAQLYPPEFTATFKQTRQADAQ